MRYSSSRAQRRMDLIGGAALAAVALAGCGNVDSMLSYKTHETKGLASFESGDYKKAEEELKLAVSMAARDKDNRAGNVGRLTYELAKLYRKQNKSAEAEETYTRALVIFSADPKLVSADDKKQWAQCLTELAEILRATDRGPEADIRERQSRELLNSLGAGTTTGADAGTTTGADAGTTTGAAAGTGTDASK